MLRLLVFLLIISFNIAAEQNYSLMGQECAYQMDKSFTGAKTKNDIDWQKIKNAYANCLSSYIQIKTISPEGNEHHAVDFLKSIFEHFQIPYKVYWVDSKVEGQDRRVNIVATLSNQNKYDWASLPEKKSILLGHHMDVVSAIPGQWENSSYPYGGQIAPSESDPEKLFIWGRGALDMKSIGLMQIFSALILKQLGINFSKDIHILAFSDEEQGSSGIIGTVQRMAKGQELYALSKATIQLNESGGAGEDLPKNGVNMHLIGVEEKGAAWLELNETNPIRLLKSLYKLRVLDIRNKIKRKRRYKHLKDYGCEFIESKTPNAKVNIVASKLHFTLKCARVFEDVNILKRVFTDGFAGVKVKVEPRFKKYVVTLETSSSGHGSIALGQSVLEVFATGLHKLNIVKFKRHFRKRKASFFREVQTNVIETFMRNLAEYNGALRFFNRFKFVPFIKRFLLRTVAGEFDIDGLFRTTCNLSSFDYKDNQSKALLDCRLLHTAIKNRKAENFIEELKKYLKNPYLRVRPIVLWNASSSPINNPEFKTIVSTLEEMDKNALVTPYLFPAGTDNKFLRDPHAAEAYDVDPVPSYGFFPVLLSADLIGTMHGSNERLPVDQIVPGLQKYTQVLENLINLP